MRDLDITLTEDILDKLDVLQTELKMLYPDCGFVQKLSYNQLIKVLCIICAQHNKEARPEYIGIGHDSCAPDDSHEVLGLILKDLFDIEPTT